MRRQKKGDEKNTVNEFNKLIVEKDKIIYKQVSRRYFGFQILKDMQRELYKAKSTDKNKDLVTMIDSGLVDLENETEQMSENEIKNKNPFEVVDC